MNDNRISWNDYFMEFAILASKRSTCLRRQVGAVLVFDRRLLTTGYNGSPPGMKHCEDIGCVRELMNIHSGERQEICRGTHAEENAILQAAINGISVKNSILYCTASPCAHCAKSLITINIKQIYYLDLYPDELALDLLKEANIEMIQLKLET